MDLKTLQRNLASAKEAGTFLIVGADDAAKRSVVRRLQEHFCDPDVGDWNVEHVDGADTDGMAVLDLVSTAPMLGDRRVVIVQNAEKLANPDELLPFVETPAPFAVLILVAAQIDKRRRFYASIKKHGQVLECDIPQGDALLKRIGEMAADAGLQLGRKSVEILAERAGDNLGRLEGEVEKLVAYAGEERTVSVDETELLVAHGDPALGQYAIFDFVDAIAEGQSDAALERLNALLAAGEAPLVVLAMIARQFRLLLGALAWQGAPLSQAAEGMGLKSTYPMRKALAQVRRWTRDEIFKGLQACATCDESMKRGVDGRRALEILTLTLAWGRKRA